MKAERWNQVDRIYQRVEEAPFEERSRLLSQLCGDDGVLRHDVESLLAARDKAGDFMNAPVLQAAPSNEAQPEPAIVAGQAFGPYQIVSLLGAGGMGQVWRARDTRVGRDVAVKFCSAQFGQRFEREARAIASLNHANICHLYDVGPNYLVMELVEGKSPQGPLPLATALRYARQIAEALEVAHDRGIVHRDLKPANVKVRPDGTVKVLDFGLAKITSLPALRSADGDTVTLQGTQDGMILGTAACMSPEQARGQPVDKRADIWAFGVMLYEMLTGESPFARPTLSDTLAAVLSSEPDCNRLPREVQRLVRRCLEKDPARRLRDIGDAWDLLDDAQTTASLAAQVHRPIWPWTLTALFAVIASVALWLAWRGTKAGEQPLTQLDVDLGPDVVLNSIGGNDVILSPDGRRIVYLSQARLFTRRLDQRAAKELPGTAGATSPFFSPDGQWLGFYAHGKLKKTSIEGGVPMELCSSEAHYTGAAWGDDDNIVASLAPDSRLYRVPARGGTPVPLTELDPQHKEITHRWPQILPGSKVMIFTVNSGITGFDDASIDAVTLTDRRRKTLVRGATFGRYVASGHLIYVSHGTLFAVPLDLDHMEIRGTPTAILDDVTYSVQFGSAQLDVSRNGTLVYRNGNEETGFMTVQWLEPDGGLKPLLSKPGLYTYPRLSRDGQRMVFIAGAGVDRGVWIYESAREIMTRLTYDDLAFIYPIWSPDGRFVVFRDHQGISWMRSDGAGEPQRLTRSPKPQMPASFTPDGKYLAYVEPKTDPTPIGGADIWIMPTANDGTKLSAGTPQRFLQTSFDERTPSFSMDGKWIAYSSDESGRAQIYVRSFPDRGAKWQVSNDGGFAPVFSPRRSELFFLGPSNQIMMARYTATNGSFLAERPHLWTQMALPPTVATTFDVSPDGQRMLALIPVGSSGQQRTRNHVVFLEHFLDELKRRAPL